MTVVKLKSAEEQLKFDIAKKYIDIGSVYSYYETEFNETVDNPEVEWETSLTFLYNLGQDKKFRNIHLFNYYSYNIGEYINKKTAKVEFIPLADEDEDDGDMKITYYLELREKQWIIIRIDYEK